MKRKIIFLSLVLILAVSFAAMLKVKNSGRKNPGKPVPTQDYSRGATPTPYLPQPSDESMEKARKEAMERLSNVKVASVYERLADGGLINRNTGDVADILKETKTDFVFRAWWRFHPIPESSQDAGDGFFAFSELKEAAETGYTYQDLKAATVKVKEKNPNAIIVGAIGAQFLGAKKTRNEITGENFNSDQTWVMALDPSKWGLKMTKEEFLEDFGRTNSGYGVKGPFYFPDITNSEFQKIFLSWAQKQIDSGVDAIWIDLLHTQAGMFNNYAEKHPDEAENALRASKESYESASKMVDEIHKYGESKGKYIYVGTWAYPAVSFPYTKPKLDFVTQNIMSKEVESMEFNNKRWDKTITDARSTLGDIPTFAVLDWASGTGTGLGVFSQTLNPEQQDEFLKKADDFFTSKGVIFAYPIHGGNMGKGSQRLSFGEHQVYDSLAPEFDTYDTIKELANKKSKN